MKKLLPLIIIALFSCKDEKKITLDNSQDSGLYPPHGRKKPHPHSNPDTVVVTPPPAPVPYSDPYMPVVDTPNAACALVIFSGGVIPEGSGFNVTQVAASYSDSNIIKTIMNIAASQYMDKKFILTTKLSVWERCKSRLKTKIYITPSSFYSGSGITYVNSATAAYPGSPTGLTHSVGFVSTTVLQGNITWIGRILAHEIAHTFGLVHQSTFTNGVLTDIYRDGCTMGDPWYQWGWILGYNTYGQIQDDNAILRAVMGLR